MGRALSGKVTPELKQHLLWLMGEEAQTRFKRAGQIRVHRLQAIAQWKAVAGAMT